jgi:DNA adenine methylase
MEPFLKWAGGKRWLAKRGIVKNSKDKRWVEPFVGSGAMFFSLEPKTALLSDLNEELINLYEVIKTRHVEFSEKLNIAANNLGHEAYYRMRSSAPEEPVLRAVRMLYLNRLAWNGLYRVNKEGRFNVPKGSKTSVSLETDDWEKASLILKNTELACRDFDSTIDECGSGDFLFVDPPYTISHSNGGFLKYNDKIFSWEDQLRLRSSLKEAARRGCEILMTNAAHESLITIYEGIAEIKSFTRQSVLAGKASARTKTEEIVVYMGESAML